jgi:hypothetical protein
MNVTVKLICQNRLATVQVRKRVLCIIFICAVVCCLSHIYVLAKLRSSWLLYSCALACLHWNFLGYS